jgi:glycosyltransferase involved in cell wall biosynthesis
MLCSGLIKTLPIQKRAEIVARWVAQPVLKPWLTRIHQYAPRALKFPDEYDRETAPELTLSIAMVTPAYNHADYIRATIDSVLSQNYPRLHYIVMDGHSNDGTQDILASYGDRLNWRSEHDNGQADAINVGFQHVSGDIMGWLNSDDLLTPGTLSYVARFFQETPDVDFVYGHRIIIDKDGGEIGRVILPPHDSNALRHGNFIPQETMFWRRRVWEALGGVDGTLQFAMDWDFSLRARAHGAKFKRLPRFLGIFRVYPEQKSQAIVPTGEDESRKLRITHVKEGYSPADFRRGFWPYLIRQGIYQRLYLMGLLTY